MQYYIDIERKKRNTAGAKAPRDIAELCKRQGMACFPMPMFPTEMNAFYQKIWLLFVCTFYWLRLEMKVSKDDLVLYQHPMYGNRVAEYFIPRIQRKKGCRFVAVIHDLESLRKGIEGVLRNNERTNELADSVLLKHFNAVICHNEHMKEYLIQQGFNENKLVCLEIFDYLCKCENIQSAKRKTTSVAIAGNLAAGKCAYIYDIVDEDRNNLTVHLYGNNFDESRANKKMIYHGSFSPEELPTHLEGSFGLVWDGNSSETCAGNTGEYLKYNNPHKTSLYLAAGMPIIVWDQAAIADFVLDNKVGITIDNLHRLEEVISEISDEQYQKMCENVLTVGRRIRSGDYFRKAMNAVNFLD